MSILRFSRNNYKHSSLYEISVYRIHQFERSWFMTQTSVSWVPEVIDINSYPLDEQASKKDKILNNCILQVIIFFWQGKY